MRHDWVLLAGTLALAERSASAPHLHAANLIPNPGFEEGKARTPSRWKFGHRRCETKGEWIAAEAKRGDRALRITIGQYTPPQEGYGAASWYCEDFAAPEPGTRLKFSDWVKADNVVSPGGWYMLRLTCYFLDAARRKVKHKDIICADGTFDWMRVERYLLVPQRTRWIRISGSLTACTGTAYFDDLHLERLAASDLMSRLIVEDVHTPVIIPRPWKTTYGQVLQVVGPAVIEIGTRDSTLIEDELTAALNGVDLRRQAAACEPGLTVKVLNSLDAIADATVRKRVEQYWDQLPDQGYVVEVTASRPAAAYLLGKTPSARLYAAQTFECLLEKPRRVWACSIVDRPEIARRGIPMGFHGWRVREKWIRRLAQLKCNYIYNCGTYLDSKFCRNWRAPFSESDLRTLKAYLTMCREYCIEPTLALAPRSTPAVIYSSDDELKLLLDKITALYAIGFRQFGLSFDDLQNIDQERLTRDADQKAYADIGAAHLSYIGRVYKHLSTLPEATLIVVPLWYGSFESNTPKQLSYLRELSRLPADVGMLYCETRLSGLAAFGQLMRRKRAPIIWDNFFATWESSEMTPPFLPPIERAKEYTGKDVDGYVVLPLIPRREDAGLSSWRTAADYLWAPSRYDPQRSLSDAVRKTVGRASYKDYAEYAAFIADARRLASAANDEAARRKTIQRTVDRLQGLRNKLLKIPDAAVREAIEQQIASDIAKFQ